MFPDLQPTGAKSEDRAVQFVPPSYITQQILDLVSGYPGMVKFIKTYEKSRNRYAYAPMLQPAIFVVDNDSGGNQVFKLVKGLGGPEVNFDTAKVWHHLLGNLYVLRTPPRTGATSPKQAMTDMEDLFQQPVLATKLGGKSFDRQKPHGDASSYGKALFADQVIRPNWQTIDFSGFIPMFEAIRAITTHHATMLAKPRIAADAVSENA